MRQSFEHNVLMMGPPGAGKTLQENAAGRDPAGDHTCTQYVRRRLQGETLPGILPKMSIDESLGVTRIYSVADQLPLKRPYCATDLSAPRTIPSATPGWWVEAIGRIPGETLQETAAGQVLAGPS
jgi:hypothetical protein